MSIECMECGTTKHLKNHPEYIGDPICVQCLHVWYCERKEEMASEVEDLENHMDKYHLNYDEWNEV